MALNVLRRVTGHKSIFATIKILPSRFYSLYEPDYLEAMKSKVPLYPTMCVKISGYVYPILESYQSFIHKIIEVMDLEVDDGYPVPLKKLNVKRFKPSSTTPAAEYQLNIYQRNILISDITSTQMPVFTRLLEATLPEGVSLSIEPYDPEKAEKRYIPDTQLLSLREELESIGKK